MKQDIENIIKKNLPEPAKGIEKVIENTEQWMNDNHDLIWEETMCEGCNKGLGRYEKYGRNLCDKCESFII